MSHVRSHELIPAYEATVDILAKNVVLTLLFGVKLDCCGFQAFGRQNTSRMETHYVFHLLLLYIGVCGYHRRPLGRVLSVCETSEQLCGLENVIYKVASNIGRTTPLNFLLI